MKRIFAILMIILCLSVQMLSLSAFADAETTVESVLAGMSTRDKVAQMLMPAFRFVLDEDGEKQGLVELPDDTAAMISEYGFGGVILFANNSESTEQTYTLVEAMQLANAEQIGRPQLLVATDQEGGKVTRLATGTQFCGNMALAAIGSKSIVSQVSYTMGSELSALGINVDFAPDLDVNSNPSNPVINVRSFSDDAEIVSKFGAAFLRGLNDSGTISAAKHFPGHGDTDTDSHTGLPMVDKSYDELLQNELIPFQMAVDEGVDMIMTAHIQYPQIETETYISTSSGEEIYLPATLSETIITDILRGDMGYDGVVVTDSLMMDAVAQNFAPEDVAALAVNAGVDLLLMPVDTTGEEGLAALADYVDMLVGLVEDGTIDSERVDESVCRILTLKEKYGLLESYERDDNGAAEADAIVGADSHHDLEWQIAKESVTLLKNDNKTLPLRAENEKTVLMVPYDNEVLSMEYAVGLLTDENSLPAGTETACLSYQDMSADDMIKAASDADNVILISELYSEQELNPNSEDGAISADIDALIEAVHQNGGTFTLISCNLPYDAARYQAADAIMICWSFRSMSEDPRISENHLQYGASMPAAAYLAFSGDESPKGNLPINIPALEDDYSYSETEILYERGDGLHYPITKGQCETIIATAVVVLFAAGCVCLYMKNLRKAK